MWLKILLISVQIFSALGIISLILMQHGKGADMGAAFGSSTSGSLFGASGSATFLSRATALLALIFFACTLALTFISSTKPKPSAGVLGAAVQTNASSSASNARSSDTDQASTKAGTSETTAPTHTSVPN